ncbi:hypothetical protein HanRHA438_Chr13g0608381 [Helianthus annuus]|nr:hypothetical protein HanIR_Chr13g0650361 [Helianthus annuus]KAJ0859082.1 hypothetical protein HanRHA438_Chr13g0608381 [Helianthus annuus]
MRTCLLSRNAPENALSANENEQVLVSLLKSLYSEQRSLRSRHGSLGWLQDHPRCP